MADKPRRFAPWLRWVSCYGDAGWRLGKQPVPVSRGPRKPLGRYSTPALPWHEERPLLNKGEKDKGIIRREWWLVMQKISLHKRHMT